MKILYMLLIVMLMFSFATTSDAACSKKIRSNQISITYPTNGSGFTLQNGSVSVIPKIQSGTMIAGTYAFDVYLDGAKVVASTMKFTSPGKHIIVVTRTHKESGIIIESKPVSFNVRDRASIPWFGEFAPVQPRK